MLKITKLLENLKPFKTSLMNDSTSSDGVTEGEQGNGGAG